MTIIHGNKKKFLRQLNHALLRIGRVSPDPCKTIPMIDNASISPVRFALPPLRVVPRVTRLRDQVDRKRYYFVLKRSIDILVSLACIACVMSWLVPLLWLLMGITTRGPLFFVQRRVGRGGKTFRCYKFRTMVPNAEADFVPALENDNRITAIGAFLRRTNIDEFPQFFNILKGDMSLVGPRPHMYTDCRKFNQLIPSYKTRTIVKPGLTGLAQIKGYHGPATTTDSIRMRYLWDTYYISHCSLRMDLRVLVDTVTQKVVAKKRHAEYRVPIGKTRHNYQS